MSPADLWFVILGGMVVTYLIRLSFITLLPHERLPEPLRKALGYVPPSVLAALILPSLAAPQGPLELTLANPRLLAGAVAGLIAWRLRNTWVTIAVGMGLLWLLS